MESKSVFCPATMCPLFAAEGSPWTGHKNAVCPERPAYNGDLTDPRGCGFFGKEGCDGCQAAKHQVLEVEKHGHTFQIGPKQSNRKDLKPRSFDCPRASDCSWQKYIGAELCPPRLALSKGIDPRSCAW